MSRLSGTYKAHTTSALTMCWFSGVMACFSRGPTAADMSLCCFSTCHFSFVTCLLEYSLCEHLCWTTSWRALGASSCSMKATPTTSRRCVLFVLCMYMCVCVCAHIRTRNRGSSFSIKATQTTSVSWYFCPCPRLVVLFCFVCAMHVLQIHATTLFNHLYNISAWFLSSAVLSCMPFFSHALPCRVAIIRFKNRSLGKCAKWWVDCLHSMHTGFFCELTCVFSRRFERCSTQHPEILFYYKRSSHTVRNSYLAVIPLYACEPPCEWCWACVPLRLLCMYTRWMVVRDPLTCKYAVLNWPSL
jgi:hypothetical protein